MKTAVAIPSSWEELPPDLLGLVLLRLPSLADRVRLRAVCRPWRAGAAARRHPLLPPPLPWLALLDGSLVDLNGAPVRCTPILREGVCGYLVVDNLAFLVHDDGGCSLMNPLSGLMLPLPQLAPVVRRALDESQNYDQSYITKTHCKAILSAPLDSIPDPLVATLMMEGYNISVSTCKQQDAITISTCPETSVGPNSTKATDIAFLHGKLYVLTNVYEGLRVMDLDAGQLIKSKSSSGFHQCIANDPDQQFVYMNWSATTHFDMRSAHVVMRYLAESSGRLLMLRRWMIYPLSDRLGDRDKTSWFEVFEADLTTIPGRWTKVDCLDGQAIFLGSECCKSVLASQCEGGIQEDCIYFMHQFFDNPSRENFDPSVDPLRDSGVYNMRNGEITPLLPAAVMAELQRKRQFLTWFFPADA